MINRLLDILPPYKKDKHNPSPPIIDVIRENFWQLIIVGLLIILIIK